MAKPALTELELKGAAESIVGGKSVTEAAKDLKVTREGLSRALRKAGYSTNATKAKTVKQTKSEVPVEQVSVVNQLEGQLGVIRDENRILKNQLAVAQKQSINFQALASEIKSAIVPFDSPPEFWQKTLRGPVKEACVLHLSDGHHDSVVLPHRVQNLEKHDFNIAMARGETLIDSVLDYTQNKMTGYDFETLWVLAYGDHTQGEIHKGVEHTHFGNMMRNCLAIGQFHAQMIRDLASWFPIVKVLYLSGNHGRRKDVPKKDYHAAWDSWDYLIAETAKAYVHDLWNVEVLIPDSFSAVVDIEGYKFCCFHGDDIKGWNSIPWYGIERKTRRLTALNATMDQKIHYYAMGHFHQMGVQAALKGETIINGAWLGTDPYCFNSLSGYNEPVQLLHGVSAKPNRGITWRLPIKLKGEEVPKRYKVSLAGVEGK